MSLSGERDKTQNKTFRRLSKCLRNFQYKSASASQRITADAMRKLVRPMDGYTRDEELILRGKGASRGKRTEAAVLGGGTTSAEQRAPL